MIKTFFILFLSAKKLWTLDNVPKAQVTLASLLNVLLTSLHEWATGLVII